MDDGDARPEVILFIVDAGGGHRSAANALLAAAEEAHLPLRFRVVSLQSVLEPLDLLRRVTGVTIEQTYNRIVRRLSLNRLLLPLLRVLQAAIRVRRRALRRAVERYLRENPANAVVSLAPNFNGILRDAVAEALEGVPFVVLLTDYADFPPHFWIEPGVSRVIVGSGRAAEQALRMGLPPERISQTSGMLLHPRFYADDGGVRHRVRAEFALPQEGFVVLVLFGGKGSREMEPLVRSLLEESSDWYVVAICGDSPSLLARMAPLEARSGGRLRVLGFTERVADFMAVADLLVTKPGPGSLAEAFRKRLPVIVVLNASTIPQERFNCRWVRESGLGVVVSHWSEIPAAAARIAREPERAEDLLRSLDALPENRAVYEALEIIGAEVGLGASVSPLRVEK